MCIVSRFFTRPSTASTAPPPDYSPAVPAQPEPIQPEPNEQPDSTVDTTYAIPATFIGHVCGTTWLNHVIAAKPSESYIRSILFGYLKTNPGAKLEDSGAKLRLPLLPDPWPALWAGPELQLIEQAPEDLATFYAAFITAAWQAWESYREWKYLDGQRQRERKADNKRLFGGMLAE